MQPKLLRFIQDREYERVGDQRTRKADVRILAATNADLEQALRENRFREDLYYRLNVIPIELPALRERREDVPPLVAHFLRRAAEEKKLGPGTITPDALERLVASLGTEPDHGSPGG